MYYTVIKHSGHLRTLEKCRKHSPAAHVFYISLLFSNARRVLSQCNTPLRLLYLLNKRWCDVSPFFTRSRCTCDIDNYVWVALFTRDDVVSQHLKFGSAFLCYSWKSKITLFFYLSRILSSSRKNCDFYWLVHIDTG